MTPSPFKRRRPMYIKGFCIKPTQNMFLLSCLLLGFCSTSTGFSCRLLRRRTTCTSSFAAAADNNNNNANPNKKSTIGDQVLNLHGGKYRFDDPSVNAIGQEFAESLYASNPENKEEEESIPEWEQWPNWAKKMGPTTPMDTLEPLLVGAESPVSVRIYNQFHTWEPYFAKIIRHDPQPGVEKPSANHAPFQIVGNEGGTLAPNGGSDNLCDENDPYPDEALVAVRQKVGHDNEQSCYVLVVGTEEEKWYYRLEQH